MMKVKGQFRTALARQVAEAVWIRRRGGEGAILNSKGEFSRSYIPRLQVVEEEFQEDAGARVKSMEHLKEQEGEWEQSRRRELGKEAVLGPRSSPLKRQKEQTEEHKSNKRRRKLQYKLIEEGWGELPSQQGAVDGEQRSPPESPLTMEQELGSEEPTSSSPLRSEQGSLAELGSQVPREQALTQTRIEDFLNPTPSNDRPTHQNLVASQGLEITATKPSSCGSPSKDEGVAVLEVEGEEERFEGLTEDTVLHVPPVPPDGGRAVGDTGAIPKVSSGGDTTMGNNTIDQIGMPSGGKSEQHCDRGKLMSMPGTNVMHVDNSEAENEKVCVHKRGGYCTTHESMGSKYVEKSKVWAKLKNGNFGYVYRQRIKYVCRDSAGA